jgi:hypothetical protein
MRCWSLVSGGGGIPRFLPDSLLEHGPASRAAAASPETSNHLRAVLQAAHRERVSEPAYDRRTRENFSREWDHHELGDKTWGIELDERVQRYFLDAVRIPPKSCRASCYSTPGAATVRSRWPTQPLAWR